MFTWRTDRRWILHHTQIKSEEKGQDKKLWNRNKYVRFVRDTIKLTTQLPSGEVENDVKIQGQIVGTLSQLDTGRSGTAIICNQHLTACLYGRKTAAAIALLFAVIQLYIPLLLFPSTDHMASHPFGLTASVYIQDFIQLRLFQSQPLYQSSHVNTVAGKRIWEKCHNTTVSQQQR